MTAALDKMQSRGELRRDEPMSRHTSWRAGGKADLFFIPSSVEDLQAFLRELDAATPIFWLGVGSNLLVRDGGIRGVVISATSILKGLERIDTYLVRAGSGVPCTQLARQCIRWGLGPSEFFAGIPGTVGGALTMNAGAHGGETWERVESVRTIDRAGEIHQRAPAARPTYFSFLRVSRTCRRSCATSTPGRRSSGWASAATCSSATAAFAAWSFPPQAS